jgi:hypothetical protein
MLAANEPKRYPQFLEGYSLETKVYKVNGSSPLLSNPDYQRPQAIEEPDAYLSHIYNWAIYADIFNFHVYKIRTGSVVRDR